MVREPLPYPQVMSPRRRPATRRWLGFLALVAAAPRVSADTAGDRLPRFELPVDCAATTCVVQNYFDHDPGKAHRDYRCGSLSYDGHTGTDIRVPSLAEMERGVPVLAAAPGRVRAVRDGMADVNLRDVPEGSLKGREAGNAVVVVHDGGWETQYSHLKRGSVQVTPGERVAAGAPVGLIGLSGRTEFPHVEFSVRQNGKPVDPFVGPAGPNGCAPGGQVLWSDRAFRALGYRATGLLTAGFAGEAPRETAVQAGQYALETIAPDAPVLAFWVEIFGARAGDEESMRLLTPGGTVLAEHVQALPGNKARWFRYVGKKRRQSPWPVGTYRGVYTLVRRGDSGPQTVVSVERQVTVR
jgi:hypothetical protein